MDTHGHHRVLAEGAAPRLERAFAQRGTTEVNLNALFLGNWLADLSQVDDPGSTLAEQLARDLAADRQRRAAGVAAQMGTRLTTTMTATAAQKAGKGDPEPALDQQMIAALSRMVRGRVEELLGAVTEAMTRSAAARSSGAPALGGYLISLVRALGYLKFAHKDSHPRGMEISFDAYARIFAELCRQYFPHEHLDRPLCSVSYGPSCESAWGAAGSGRRDRLYAVGRSSAGADRHLYSYLADDRLILAGRLTEIDLGWASRDLAPATRMPAEDRDLWLARLGHVLHGVEDFFAHSTFTEHAIVTASGAQGLTDALAGRSVRRVGEPPASPIAADKVRRRLLRYSPDLDEPGAAAASAEDAVVTGYFDGWDTLNSLLHFAEELIRPRLHGFETRERRGPLIETMRALLNTYASATVDDVLDLLKIVPAGPGDTVDTKIHQSLGALFDYVDDAAAHGEAISDATVGDRMAADPVLAHLPPSLRDSLIFAVRGLSLTFRVGKQTWTTYRAIKAISEFATDPWAYMLKPLTADGHKTLLKAYARVVAELVGKDALVELNYVLLNELQTFFRADRVGCHSLLAKDQPTEPLYDEMFACARHVDWLLVDTLCRWSDREWAATTPPHLRFVRWPELLGEFLRAPVDVPRAQVRRVTWRLAPVLRRHEVTRGDETLRTAYQALLGLTDSAQEVGSYEEFLVANLGATHTDELFIRGPTAGTRLDERRAVEFAVAGGLAVPTPGGHRLVRGARLVLPVRVSITLDRVETSTWFTDVIALRTLAEWQAATQAYELTRLTTVPAEFQHVRPTYHPGITEEDARLAASRFAAAATTIRRNLETQYPHR